jgi:hypothetical protein
MYKTILTIVVGFVVLSEFFHSENLTLIAILIGVLALISNIIGYKIEWIWEKIGSLLGKIVPNLLLTIIFYFFLFPLSIIKRITSKGNPLFLKNTETSYFVLTEKHFSKSDLEKMW